MLLFKIFGVNFLKWNFKSSHNYSFEQSVEVACQFQLSWLLIA